MRAYMNQFGEWVTSKPLSEKQRPYTYQEYEILEKAYKYEQQRNKDLEYIIETLELSLKQPKKPKIKKN